MTYILIKFECNWADEFDVHGFKLMQQDEWERYINNIPESPGTLEYYFGTNEAFEWNDKHDYLRHFKVIEISDADAEIIKRLFTQWRDEVFHGEFPIFEEYMYPETET